MLLDPFMASLISKTSSIDPYIKGEVWSLLSALKVPYIDELESKSHFLLESISKM